PPRSWRASATSPSRCTCSSGTPPTRPAWPAPAPPSQSPSTTPASTCRTRVARSISSVACRPMVEHVVVVGASLAGLRTAQSLRSNGFTGAVTLVGEEHHPPYDRPPLSKHVLSGEWQPEQARL